MREPVDAKPGSHPRADRRRGPPVWLFLAALALGLSVWAQGFKVTTRTDRTRLRIGENLIFTLVLSGSGSAIPQPVLPPLTGFKLVGQYMTSEAGADGPALLYHYLLTPTEAGHLEVPEFSLRLGGQTTTLKGFSADVETAPSQAPPPRPAPVSTPPMAGKDMLLSGSLSANEAAVGQPVIYTLHLLTLRSARGLDLVTTPDFAGFQKVEDLDATRNPSRQATRDGRLYLDVVVKRWALFPLRTGTLSVGDFTAELGVESQGARGSSLVRVTGGAASLHVLALPAPPLGFKGAVGSFRLSAAVPAPARADLGQPFTLALRIDGAGFLPESPLDVTSSPFFSAYPPTAEDSSGFAQGAYRTMRTIRMPILPKLAGAAVLAPARLVYFDPGSRAYKTLESGGGKILVTGKENSVPTAVNLAPLVSNPRPGPPPRAALLPALFAWLLALPFAASALLAAWLAFYRTFLTAPEKARARRLLRQQRRALAQARRALDVRKAGAFHDALSRALTAILDARLGKPTGGLSRDQLRDLLESARGSQEADAILWLREELETARYAPERPTRQDLQSRYDAVARLAKGDDRG